MLERTTYFGASIRGGRDDQELYHALIKHVEQYGTVLTEHIGSSELKINGEDGLTDQEIYERDITWLDVADVVVAEVTTPSLGVGYEIAKAEEWGKPVLCLHRPTPNRRLSAIIGGTPYSRVVQYADEASAKKAIDDFYAELDARATSHKEAPFCDVCGHLTVRNGASFKCLNCGNTMP